MWWRLLVAVWMLSCFARNTEAVAATQTIIANIRFETALSFSNKSDISVGTVVATRPGTYVISPTGALSAANGGVLLGGDAHAGNVTISGSNTQTINIAASNYVANNGVTPSAATCSYSGGSAGPCALSGQVAPGTGKPLLLGVTLVVDGTQPIHSTATPSFDVVVTYN